jgi:hypothetical protein
MRSPRARKIDVVDPNTEFYVKAFPSWSNNDNRRIG